MLVLLALLAAGAAALIIASQGKGVTQPEPLLPSGNRLVLGAAPTETAQRLEFATFALVFLLVIAVAVVLAGVVWLRTRAAADKPMQTTEQHLGRAVNDGYRAIAGRPAATGWLPLMNSGQPRRRT
jgi:hypothetical protein